MTELLEVIKELARNITDIGRRVERLETREIASGAATGGGCPARSWFGI